MAIGYWVGTRIDFERLKTVESVLDINLVLFQQSPAPSPHLPPQLGDLFSVTTPVTTPQVVTHTITLAQPPPAPSNIITVHPSPQVSGSNGAVRLSPPQDLVPCTDVVGVTTI